jgi:hypothetical protein
MSELMTSDERVSIKEVGISTGSGSRLSPTSFNEVVRFAEVMAKADFCIPKVYRNNPGACMAVSMIALDVQMNPFTVAQKCYQVNGQMGMEAQLMVAIVNARAGLAEPLEYSFAAEGLEMSCTVRGVLKGGHERTYSSPPISALTVKNSPLWKTDPQQQLGYYAARSWARRYCPEVIMGLYSVDEAQTMPQEPMNITEDWNPLNDVPAAGDATDHEGEVIEEAAPDEDNAQANVMSLEIDKLKSDEALMDWQALNSETLSSLHPAARKLVMETVRVRFEQLEAD